MDLQVDAIMNRTVHAFGERGRITFAARILKNLCPVFRYDLRDIDIDHLPGIISHFLVIPPGQGDGIQWNVFDDIRVFTFFRVVPLWPVWPPRLLAPGAFCFFSRFGSDDGGLLLLRLLSPKRFSNSKTRSSKSSTEAFRAGDMF